MHCWGLKKLEGMPSVVKHLLLLASVVGLFGAPAQAAASTQAQGGLTLAPAALTLELAKGNQQQTGSFTLTNHYRQPVTLHFALEPRVGVPGDNVAAYLAVSYTDLTIAPGESTAQSLTLRDSKQLAPGSQLADLVITQLGAASGNVAVQPSIRMPLTIIKQDGAVASVALSSLSLGHLGILLPGSLTTRIANTGNMVAIPRGVISITAPNGTVVRRGVLNTASQAVSPQATLALTTPLNTLANAYLPGVYRTSVSYGLGGGQPARVATSWFFYIAWWHLLALILLGVTVYFVRKRLVRLSRSKVTAKQHRPPTRRILIGRNA